MTSTLDADLTHDAFLGGRLHLWQPRAGYRAGVDPVLLAASVPAKSGQAVLDLGCGVGTAALCLGARVPGLALVGVERQRDYAALAARNGLETFAADLTDLPDAVRYRSFDHVLANPPFFDRDSGHVAADQGREAGRGAETPIAAWIDAAARRLRHKGYLHMIHRAERVPDLLAGAHGRLGSPEIWPLCPRVGKPAELVIFRARKDGRADFRLHFPIILHEGARHERDGESYTPEIQAILRAGAALHL
ncbi:tRNA1(Val) (adenine(37)-N6)-methyltransferase [Tateyamaria omphalii]|uniref:Methyltransferase n=1 Tax=Tateyamaria omphalii TaxID=299262 RepID=A0A1P8MVZ7_9RHOB|nr:methyltransferase [Tateyamaria omphalii]APX12277.1 methyltransferase [Tateyamaria omphalii]